MEKLQAKLLEKADNIKKLGNVLEKMDRDKDNVLSLKELEDGLKTLGVELTAQEVADVFKELDKDGSQTLDLQEFFVAVRGCLSEAKQAILMKVYSKLDKDGSGEINYNDLKDGFDFQFARDSKEEAVKDFMEGFDDNKDGKVSKAEFLNFHAAWSDWSDEFFISFLTDVWKLPSQEEKQE